MIVEFSNRYLISYKEENLDDPDFEPDEGSPTSEDLEYPDDPHN